MLTEEGAAGALKAQTPELMVSTVYRYGSMIQEETAEAEISSMVKKVVAVLPRLHCLVIGPGLGRDENVLAAVAQIIEAAKAAKLPLVLDADGLWLIQSRPDLIQGYAEAVLTPNKAEYPRLAQALAGKDAPIEELCSILQGPTIVQKGAVDRIAGYGRRAVLECCEEGAPRRPGGLGDLLAGTLGVLVSWCKPRRQANALGCQAGCHVIRKACALAFEKKKRSMLATDVLDELGQAFEDMCPAQARRKLLQ